jgi:hypothetical protein
MNYWRCNNQVSESSWLVEEARELVIEAVETGYWCGELEGSLRVVGEEQSERDRTICGSQGRTGRRR